VWLERHRHAQRTVFTLGRGQRAWHYAAFGGSMEHHL
jgi:hypothetical protein